MDSVELNFHVFYPNGNIPTKKTPTIVFFFGGGWTGGTPTQFYEQSEYFASRGMIAISAEYRTKSKHNTTPFECVKDGKSAVRWLRGEGLKIGVDPDRIVASGGSAGGHVAACTGVIEGYEEQGENLNISSKPNAMILFNPVLDTTKKGYGWKKMNGQETVISPVHQIKEGIPPTLTFHGDADKIVPYENAARFDSLMRNSGNKSILITAQGENHGFFNGSYFRKNSDGKYFEEYMHESDVFLKELGYVNGKPTALKKVMRIACVGDSNTARSYPKQLGALLGNQFIVKNYGKGASTIIDGSLFPYSKTKEYKSALASLPNAVIIMLGTNDANPKWWNSKRETSFKGTAAEEFTYGLYSLINSFANLATKPDIILCKPIPVFVKNDSGQEGRRKNLEEKIAPLIAEVAKKHNLKLVDLYQVLKNKEELSTDGVHYKEEGYRLIAEELKTIVQKKY